jgi:hypothetical protein
MVDVEEDEYEEDVKLDKEEWSNFINKAMLYKYAKKHATKKPFNYYVCASFNSYNVGARLGSFHEKKLEMEHRYDGNPDIDVWVEDDKHNIIDMREFCKDYDINGFIKLKLMIKGSKV